MQKRKSVNTLAFVLLTCSLVAPVNVKAGVPQDIFKGLPAFFAAAGIGLAGGGISLGTFLAGRPSMAGKTLVGTIAAMVVVAYASR